MLGDDLFGVALAESVRARKHGSELPTLAVCVSGSLGDTFESDRWVVQDGRLLRPHLLGWDPRERRELPWRHHPDRGRPGQALLLLAWQRVARDDIRTAGLLGQLLKFVLQLVKAFRVSWSANQGIFQFEKVLYILRLLKRPRLLEGELLPRLRHR